MGNADKTLKQACAEINDMGLNHSTNIFQRMLMAQTKLVNVNKNLVVGEGKNQYKAVSERDVLDAVKKVEDECGIYSYPVTRKTFELKETTNKYGTVNQWIRIETKYRFVNVDKPEEYIEVDTYGDGVDAQDKAPGKAMTYADKYALMKAYKISTGDDPDTDASEPQEPLKDQQKQKNIGELITEWNKLRKNMNELGIDFREESIKQWIANHTGYGDQEADPTDPVKMGKLCEAYNKLIAGKKAKNG